MVEYPWLSLFPALRIIRKEEWCGILALYLRYDAFNAVFKKENYRMMDFFDVPQLHLFLCRVYVEVHEFRIVAYEDACIRE